MTAATIAMPTTGVDVTVMPIVSAGYGATLCQRFAQVHEDLPGSWAGITAEDRRHLLKGPGDRSTAEGWLQDKMYDAAWVEVVQNGRYTTPDGCVYRVEIDPSGDLIFVRGI